MDERAIRTGNFQTEHDIRSRTVTRAAEEQRTVTQAAADARTRARKRTEERQTQSLRLKRFVKLFPGHARFGDDKHVLRRYFSNPIQRRQVEEHGIVDTAGVATRVAEPATARNYGI